MTDAGDHGRGYARFLDAAPRPPEAPARPEPPARNRVRRAVRRTVLLAALFIAVATLGWTVRVADTDARIDTVLAHGPPERPSLWTRANAALRGPPRVGLQIGHLHARRHPDELARLRTSTGGEADGLREVDVNRAVAEATAARLAAAGVRVDLLPATVPPGYRADLLLSLHADASPDPTRRGYKSAHPVPPRSAHEPWARRTIDAVYLDASGLPDDDANVTRAMTGYYAFDARRFRHAAARGTPGVILELGYLSHPADRALLLAPERPAAAIADGVVRYLVAIDRWHPASAPASPASIEHVPPPPDPGVGPSGGAAAPVLACRHA